MTEVQWRLLVRFMIFVLRDMLPRDRREHHIRVEAFIEELNYPQRSFRTTGVER